MWKFIRIYSLVLLPLLIGARPPAELEVRLETRASLKPVYLSRLYTDSAVTDWRYFDELRSVLEFDLNTSGFCSIASRSDELESAFQFPDVRSDFNLAVWKKEKIPYAVAIQSFKNRFQTTVFNTEKGTSKKYPDFLITGRLEQDRKQIHLLFDTIQKDLFGVEGIASLRLLFAHRTKNEDKGMEWLSEIWVSDFDGANARQLTREKSYCLSPGFFPKTAEQSDPEFFYVSEKAGQAKIYRSSLSKPGSEPIVDLRGNQALPSLTAKGNQMAFITDVAGRPDLFVQNFDPKGKIAGKARQLFSSSRATQASPTYSPDGKKIAFVSDKDGPPRVYVMAVSGPKDTQRASPRLLTKKNRENTSPCWSPDGTKLAYSSKVEGVRQIWVYDFATEEEVQITTGPENKENPSWAPDSFHLVYNSESNDVSELYLIHLNRGDPIQITKGPGQKRFASWEPR